MKDKQNKGWSDKQIHTGKNVGIVIGRFSPFHLGHAKLIQTALQNSDRLVILLGSAGRARDIKNPWNELDRVAMLNSIVQEYNLNGTKICYESIRDHYKDEQWLIEVKTKVRHHIEPNDQVTLYGNDKDHSTYYLNLFPDWKLVNVDNYLDNLNATKIREFIFEGQIESAKEFLPHGVYDYLTHWIQSDDYGILHREYEHLKDYKKQFEGLPYDPFFVTVDAVITYRGHVLTIKRKAMPGLGLMAMPGGFIKTHETLLDGIKSIVKKKTGITLSNDWLKRTHVFDRPNRSLRGRTITHVFRFDLPVKTKDYPNDSCQWIDFADVAIYSNTFFEDHAMILQEMLK